MTNPLVLSSLQLTIRALLERPPPFIVYNLCSTTLMAYALSCLPKGCSTAFLDTSYLPFELPSLPISSVKPCVREVSFEQKMFSQFDQMLSPVV